ncbi:hypothetical protein C1646_777563 [Rhizophagus diaphanus]|nr:hypothetical protein C1646_777563 [Rhizophagus diaphanus] [Rhizophagus sp. MUCL 43196]
MERFYANDIHTWIALKKPTFKELIHDKPCAYIIFHAIFCLNATTVTQKTYKYDILGELRDAFGWKVKELGDEPNIGISKTFDTMHLDDKGNAPDESADKYLWNICNAEVIRVSDELWILKDYELMKDGKKVTNIIDGKLTVILIDHEEKQNIISSLNKLEKWLLDEFKLDKEYRPKDYHNCTANILIKREGKFLGNIRESIGIGKDLGDVDVKVKFIIGLSPDNKKRAEEFGKYKTEELKQGNESVREFYQKLKRLRKLFRCDEKDIEHREKIFCGLSPINQEEVKSWEKCLPLDELIERLETLELLSE